MSELEQVRAVHRQLEPMWLTEEKDLRNKFKIESLKKQKAFKSVEKLQVVLTSKYSPEENGKKGSSRSS